MGIVLDVVILALCLLLGLRGLLNGFMRETLSLVAFVVGFIVAKYFGESLSIWLIQQFALASTIAIIIAYVILFVFAYLFVKIAERFLTRFVNIIMLTGLNRVCGVFVGILEAIIVVYLVVLIIKSQTIFPALEEQLRFSESQLLPWIDVIGAKIRIILNV